MPPENNPNLLVGSEKYADATIYRLTPEIAIVQTLDFFTPIVNEPFDFGRIAAANSFSDIYAMGGRPVTAMNIVCFPIKDMDKSVLQSIIEGGLKVIHEAGAVMAGGHSVEDPEIKYGLSVTGIVHPEKYLNNDNAKSGDILILTKPIGTGILATAMKGGLLNEKVTKDVTEIMATLNKGASEAMVEIGVNAATDITGFGLLGHAIEMAKASNVGIKIFSTKVPIIPDALIYASMGIIPEGSHRNRNFCSKHIKVSEKIDPIRLDILTDAQTSGGLLISVQKERAELLQEKLKEKHSPSFEIIGEVFDNSEPVIEVL